MSAKAILPILLGIFVLCQGVWILFFRPDPPADARIATRTSRRIVALCLIAVGALNLFLQFSDYQ